jgi:hypothetical protein
MSMSFTALKKYVADGGEIHLIRAEYTNEDGKKLKDNHESLGVRVKGKDHPHKPKLQGKAGDWTITDRHATFDDGITKLVYYIADAT